MCTTNAERGLLSLSLFLDLPVFSLASVHASVIQSCVYSLTANVVYSRDFSENFFYHCLAFTISQGVSCFCCFPSAWVVYFVTSRLFADITHEIFVETGTKMNPNQFLKLAMIHDRYIYILYFLIFPLRENF